MARISNFIGAVFAAAVLILLAPAARCFSQSQLPYPYVPIFQYNVFYNLNLEVDPASVMPVAGPVFCNASMWSGTPNVAYASTVESVGAFSTNHWDPFVANYAKFDPGTPKSDFLYPGQPISGVAPVTFPVGGVSITNAEAILQWPPSACALGSPSAYTPEGETYLANQADLIISNAASGIGTTLPKGTNFFVYFQDPMQPLNSNSNNWCSSIVWVTNDYYIVSNFTTRTLFSTNYVPASRGADFQVWYAGYTFLTNVTFYDYREQATVRAVQIDVGRLGAWITNAAPNGGSNWNHQLTWDTAHGIDSIFVYNAVPFFGQQQLPAVRLVKGQLLPSDNGLTVVTPQPLYILGNYNVQTNGGQPVLDSHNTVNTYPAALMADAITVLSSNWSDAYNVSTSIASRIAADTTVNAACLTGIVQSSGTNYSGGLENSFHFLENWIFTFTYNGSMAGMFSSVYATNVWPGTGSVYNPPYRNWGFDTNFLIFADLPPLTPILVNSNAAPALIAQPSNAVVLTGQTTNFIVSASGVPAVSYQWSFDGTNITGATNDVLLLAGVESANAGDYAVEVSNVLGSVISSNALLSVYTSAVPVLNAFSFSPVSGMEFSVVGVPGFNYTVEASTNLIDWVPLMTSNSPFIFADTNTNLQQQFYRGVYVP